MLLGGRTAEEITFGEITTGASDDIERCTEIARSMVTQFGMSELLGPQQLAQTHGEVFLGRDFGHEPTYSPSVAGTVDAEVRRLIDTAHDRARAILTAHRTTLQHMADRLVAQETLDDSELAAVFGEIDKGIGIDLPEPKQTEEPPPVERELVGASANAVADVDATAPAPRDALPEPIAARRRWMRWRSLRAPRPSGT